MTTLEAPSEADAVELLHAKGCTDGLPVIVPTPARVDAMITRVDLDPDLVLGEMGPKQGAATVRLVAAAAVMAGCLPDHFPVVVAAVRAICRSEFDLTEVTQTTHCVAPFILVNGPARETCGPIGSGIGIMGPGDRAGASIGRALSLAIINIGGRRSGVTDMASFSSPLKFTCCFAEAEEASPFEPYHVQQGFDPDDSVVTVVAVEGPHSLLHEHSLNPENDADRLIRCISGVVANSGSNHVYYGGIGAVVVVLNPEHAAVLVKAGYDRNQIAEEIVKHATLPRDYANALYAEHLVTKGGNDEFLPAVRSPEQIMLVIAGGVGGYSMVMPSWALAPHGNLPVSEKIDVFPSCGTLTV